jgi:hypothetical protein
VFEEFKIYEAIPKSPKIVAKLKAICSKNMNLMPFMLNL